MPNIYGRFSDQNDIVTTGLSVAANNNLTAANATIAETDQLRGTAVILQPTGLLATITNDLPNVTSAIQGDVGAALGGIGQEGTPSTEPGGGSGGGGGPAPCFLGNTLFTLWTPAGLSRILMAELYENYIVDPTAIHTALSFNDQNKPVMGEVEKVFKNTAHEYLHVTFEDYTADDVTPEHPYFSDGEYKPIKDLLHQYIVTEEDKVLMVTGIICVQVPDGIPVYNAHIKTYANYCANGRRVHNLCPIENNF